MASNSTRRACDKILFLGTSEDQNYLPRLKRLCNTSSLSAALGPVNTWAEVSLYCQKNNIKGVLTDQVNLLKRLTGDDSAKINDYAGSYFCRDGIEVVILDPLPQLVSLPYGEFVARRYISKLSAPQEWNTYPAFSYSLLTASNAETIYEEFSHASFIAVDIETVQVNLAITSVAYTAVYLDGTGPNGAPRISTIVLEMDSEFALALLRRFNSLPAPKVLQNGKYDHSYLLRYNAPVYNWLGDTATAFHCWYSELPKDLGMLSAFFHREGRFWKDMAGGDKSQKLEYNGRDTFATAIVWCEWLLQAPRWAVTNYLQEFPINFACLLAEMTGVKRDMTALEKANAEITAQVATLSARLDTMLGVRGFNVSSPKQMKQLLTVLGCGDLQSTDEKNLNKAAFRHPLIARIVDVVLEIRGLRKLLSTYLTPGKEFNGIILWALNPHGTDTGRLASKEHHFWCGLQGQNIPRGVEVKQTLVAYDDFRLAEVDLEQAESRDTAHIAGCESLISAVSGTRDFHSVNASAFFGVSYESIYQDAVAEYVDNETGKIVPGKKGKTLNKVLRDLAKRVNHGANYNMGANVLVETMGLVNIYKAAAALKLPPYWTPKQIAEFLLACFHKVYPELQKVYYEGVKAEVKATRMLTSTAVHDSPYHVSGWVRYCFSNPDLDKRALNSYVAHSPQSLNAMTLNKAFMRVFYDLALSPVHSSNFRLNAQIHDSILFQFRTGHEYLAEEVRKRMEIPVTVKGYDGKTRTFTVPAAIKAGKDGEGALRWSETE